MLLINGCIVTDSFLEVSIDAGIVTVYLMRAPVNALSGLLRDQLYSQLAVFLNDNSVKGIVITTKDLPFSAGADIKEFSKGLQGKSFVDFYELLSLAQKPVIAGIDLYAYGGGLELAMLCHYRVAHVDALFGQPEIKLGIIPGGTGTQSLPRLIGIKKALTMMLTGRPIGAQEALELGLIDSVTNEPVALFAQQYLSSLLESKAYRTDIPLHLHTVAYDKAILDAFYAQAEHYAFGFTCPKLIIDCVVAACNLSPKEGVAFEQNIFMNLITGPQTASLRYMFMQELMSKQVIGLDAKRQITSFQQIGVVGAGMMGCGIAQAIARCGYAVTVVEADMNKQASAEKGVLEYFTKQAKKRKISLDEAKRYINNISFTTALEELRDCDVVIEAVFEQMEVKKKVFASLDNIVKPHAVLATNTSSLDIDQIAEQTRYPERVIGMHFFSPAPVMRLLEVVRAKKTADNVLLQVLNFAKSIKKLPVVVKVCPGFVGNRMVIRYFKQVEYLLLRGVTPTQIDSALQGFGFAMGPCAMADMSGLDISVDMQTGPSLAQQMVENNRLGQKNLSGFYDYKPKDTTPMVSEEAIQIAKDYACSLGIKPRQISDEEIIHRCVLSLVDEAVAIVAEGVVERAGNIDVVYVYGYGFPAYRGGPLFYADQFGLNNVCRLIKQYKKEDVADWLMHPLLSECMRAKKPISQYKRR